MSVAWIVIACSGSARARTIASVYGSSPDAQPALHTRSERLLRDRSAGTTTSSSAAICGL